MVKKLPANAGAVRGTGSTPGWGRSPGGGHGNPLQYSCREHPMDKRAWRVIVHGKESDSMHARQNKLGICLVFRKVRSLHSGSRESIMTSSHLNDAAGGCYLPFTSEAAEAPCLVDGPTKTPQTWAVQGPFLLLLTAQYCLHVSCAARIFRCEPLLGVGAEAPRSGW